jgi:hypothetical protein
MAELLKRAEKAPKLPVLKADDPFKKNFFKVAKYFGKALDFSEVNFLEKLMIVRGESLEGYKLYSYDEAPENARITAQSVCFNRGKKDTMEGILLFCKEKGDRVIAVCPELSSTQEGVTYVMRRYMTSHAKCTMYSFGYLFLGAMIEEALKGVATQCLFKYPSNHWGRSLESQLYVNGLKSLFEFEKEHVLNLEFSKMGSSTIATFRSDKKYQDEELNKKTKFNKLGFRKVEVDTEKYEGRDFDYFEFARVEADFEAIYNQLPHAVAQPELKFRKLGKHKATGLYSPNLNILAVDVRHTESFIHEYGHYLDFKYGTSTFSESEEFLRIARVYRSELLKLSRQEKYSAAASKLDYYSIPTEIFARGFELWVQANIVSKSTLLANPDTYANKAEYVAFNQVKNALFSFYNKTFSVAEKAEAASKVVSVKEEKMEVFEQLSLF